MCFHFRTCTRQFKSSVRQCEFTERTGSKGEPRSHFIACTRTIFYRNDAKLPQVVQILPREFLCCEFMCLQECIPIGCVPCAAVAVSLGGGVCPGRGCLTGGVCQTPLDRMTDACEKITLPQLLLRTVKLLKSEIKYTDLHKSFISCSILKILPIVNKMAPCLEAWVAGIKSTHGSHRNDFNQLSDNNG